MIHPQNNTSETKSGTEKDNSIDALSCHTQLELIDFPSSADVFQAVFENTLFASCITNSNGKTLNVNEKICKIFGYESKEMTGMNEKDLFETNLDNYKKYLLARNTTGKAKALITGKRKSGEKFLCEISSFNFFDNKGDERTIDTIVDISKYSLPAMPAFLKSA